MLLPIRVERAGRGSLVDKADDFGAEGRVRVTVLDGNPARRLYTSEGFRLVATRTGRLAGNEAFEATGHVLERR